MGSKFSIANPAASSRLDEGERFDAAEAALCALVDLDVLRGWREVRDPVLSAPHVLPALAHLIRLDDDERELGRQGIYGPDLLVGRYHIQHGPVDLTFGGLRDHETYKMGAPHLQITLDHQRGWCLRPLSPTATTTLDGVYVGETQRLYGLRSGNVLRMGVARFVFEGTDVSYEAWVGARAQQLEASTCPALFLMRNGAICGPRLELDMDRAFVVGRSFPRPEEAPGQARWAEHHSVDWDLAGLFEHERKHVGFRHARLVFEDGSWMLEPLSKRQRTYVNRSPIFEPIALKPGDEVGMGSVLFHFHDPGQVVLPGRKDFAIEVVDWSAPRSPITVAPNHAKDEQ